MPAAVFQIPPVPPRHPSPAAPADEGGHAGAAGAAVRAGHHALDGGPGVAPRALWSAPAWAPWWYAPWRMLANALPGLLLALLLLALLRKALLAFVLALRRGGPAVRRQRTEGRQPRHAADAGRFPDGRTDGRRRRRAAQRLPAAQPVAVPADRRGVRRCWSRWSATSRRCCSADRACRLAGGRWSRSRCWARCCARPAVLVASSTAAGALGMQPWSAKATARHTGLVSSLMLFRLQYGSAERDKPDVNAALQLMASYEPAIQRARKPRQRRPPTTTASRTSWSSSASRSSIRPSSTAIRRAPTSCPTCTDWRATACPAQMHSPTFGGGTIRTEFEVLTGPAAALLPGHPVPVPADPRQGHPRHRAAAQGQRLPDPGRARRRRRASGTASPRSRRWASTSSSRRATSPRTTRCTTASTCPTSPSPTSCCASCRTDGPPRFVLGISIEAHGPYDQDYGIDTKVRDAIPVPAGVTGSAKTAAAELHLSHPPRRPAAGPPGRHPGPAQAADADRVLRRPPAGDRARVPAGRLPQRPGLPGADRALSADRHLAPDSGQAGAQERGRLGAAGHAAGAYRRSTTTISP